MANTKNLNHAQRKTAKRVARQKLKAVEAKLTTEQRNKLRRARKEKHIGVRAFLASSKA